MKIDNTKPIVLSPHTKGTAFADGKPLTAELLRKAFEKRDVMLRRSMEVVAKCEYGLMKHATEADPIQYDHDKYELTISEGTRFLTPWGYVVEIGEPFTCHLSATEAYIVFTIVHPSDVITASLSEKPTSPSRHECSILIHPEPLRYHLKATSKGARIAQDAEITIDKGINEANSVELTTLRIEQIAKYIAYTQIRMRLERDDVTQYEFQRHLDYLAAIGTSPATKEKASDVESEGIHPQLFDRNQPLVLEGCRHEYCQEWKLPETECKKIALLVKATASTEKVIYITMLGGDSLIPLYLNPDYNRKPGYALFTYACPIAKHPIREIGLIDRSDTVIEKSDTYLYAELEKAGAS